MTATNLYHVGILVSDLDAAIEHYSSLLGISFRPPRTVPMTGLRVGGQAEERELTLSYSREGPPYLELIQAHEDGLWGAQHGEGVHHVGGWQAGLDERAEEFRGLGYTLAATVPNAAGGLRAVFLDAGHEHMHGVRFELLVPGPPGGGLWRNEE